MIAKGAPLAAAARCMGLPLWLRRIPPEAFAERMPRLPQSAGFATAVANHLPQADAAQRWLENVVAANGMADETFAVWIARQPALAAPDLSPCDFAGVALWAWFSARPALPAAQLIGKPFETHLELKEAVARARDWLDRLEFPIFDAPYATHWPDYSCIDGFEFVPLASAADVLEESRALQNCLGTYASCLASGEQQIWSIRHNGVRVAGIELSITGASQGMPEIYQVRGPRNAHVSDAVLRACYRWLLSWPEIGTDLAYRFRRGVPDETWYRHLMKPYWLDRGLQRWLPLSPGEAPFTLLQEGLRNILQTPAERSRTRRLRRIRARRRR